MDKYRCSDGHEGNRGTTFCKALSREARPSKLHCSTFCFRAGNSASKFQLSKLFPGPCLCGILGETGLWRGHQLVELVEQFAGSWPGGC